MESMVSLIGRFHLLLLGSLLGRQIKHHIKLIGHFATLILLLVGMTMISTGALKSSGFISFQNTPRQKSNKGDEKSP